MGEGLSESEIMCIVPSSDVVLSITDPGNPQLSCICDSQSRIVARRRTSNARILPNGSSAEEEFVSHAGVSDEARYLKSSIVEASDGRRWKRAFQCGRECMGYLWDGLGGV